MEIQVRGNGVAINDGLREFVDRRADEARPHASIVSSTPNSSCARLHNRVGPDTTAAQITIRSGREVLRAEERAADQMRGRRPGLRQAGAADPPRPRQAVAPPRPWSGDDPRWRRSSPSTIVGHRRGRAGRRTNVGDLVRTKRFAVKPMDVDEAIEQMELLGHDFFLFHYVDEDIPSVVYRRRDGAYGLLIPKGG